MLAFAHERLADIFGSEAPASKKRKTEDGGSGSGSGSGSGGGRRKKKGSKKGSRKQRDRDMRDEDEEQSDNESELPANSVQRPDFARAAEHVKAALSFMEVVSPFVNTTWSWTLETLGGEQLLLLRPITVC